MEKESLGPEVSDGENLARYCRVVLGEYGIRTTETDISEALRDIAAASAEEAPQLIMDLMGNCGLEPDEAFVRVMELSSGEIEAILPNPSQKIAAICGALLAESGHQMPDELEQIATQSGRGALGSATNLLVGRGLFASTQEALEAIDPDGSLREEVDSQ